MTVAVKEPPTATAEANASSRTHATAPEAEEQAASAGVASNQQQQHEAHKHHKQKHQHKGQHHTQEQPAAGSKRNNRRRGNKRIVGSLALAAFVVVAVVWSSQQALQDERVRAAVNDGVQRINTTLLEHFDVRMDGFLEQLARVHERVSAIIDVNDDALRPGQLAAQAGLRAHHPILIIPGFVTSGLELWQGEPCAQTFFRQRLWGTLSMAQTLLSDRACWMRHMKLDPVTGGDPPGIKLRAARALEAVDYFVPGYWVFSKLIQSLSDIGYDNNNLIAVPYDWRLPIPLMEKRDGFFTRVKAEAELQMQLSRGVKPLLLSHSYGASVTMTFLTWAEQQHPGWVEAHLAGYVNLAGPLLGLPKAISPLLSGESRETVDIMAGLAVLVEQYLGKQSRAGLFRTWGSMLAMLPVGGHKVWGNASVAPDDDDRVRSAGRSYGGIIAEVLADAKLNDAVHNNDSSLLPTESLALLTTTLSNWGALIKNSLSSASDGDDDDDDEDDEGQEQKGGAAQGAKGGAAAGGKNGNMNGGKAHHHHHHHDGHSRNGHSHGKEAGGVKGTSGAAGEGPGAAAGAPDTGPTATMQELDRAEKVDADQDSPDLHGLQEGKAEEGLKVRFLDITHAITALAQTAGEQFTQNLKRWAPAGKAMQARLDAIIRQQREAAEVLAAQSRGTCTTSLGDYVGTCSSGGGRGGGSEGGSSNGGSGTGEQQQGAQQQQQRGSGGEDGSGQCEPAGGLGGSNERCTAGTAEGRWQHPAGSDGGGDSSTSGSSSSSSSSGTDGGGEEREEEGTSGVVPANVLKVPLPNAPDFKVFCFYGIGTDTERGYHYLKTRKEGPGGALHTEWSINNMANHPESGLQSGVQLSPDGDGTVPLLSLGALCAGGWHTKRLNPAGIQVVTREYPNNPVPVFKDARGGPNASTHVELLGNEPMLMDLLHVAAGRGSEVKDRYLTDIQNIAARIPWDEL